MSLASYYCSTPLYQIYYKRNGGAMNDTILRMKETESAGGIVMNARGEVALVAHGTTGFWSFPKGHIDEGEDALAAAVREIEEETGLQNITCIKKLGSYQRYKGNSDGSDDTSELKTLHFFLFTTTDEKLAPQDPANPEARWIAVADVEKILTHPKDREFFRHVLSQLTAPL